MIAVFPNGEAQIEDFVKEIGPSLTAVGGQDFRDLRILGTPTLVLVDSAAKVHKVWTGKLSPEEEREVLEVVQRGGP
jgi:hypothetical protein